MYSAYYLNSSIDKMANTGGSRRGYSSGVEHSTTDREVPGSIPGVPLLLLRF